LALTEKTIETKSQRTANMVGVAVG